jgi:acyl carrier protein phosphodiesterase
LIDSFTDSHPAVRRSISRLEPPYRRYGGILVDIFYDHFLANDWSEYTKVSLEDFAREAYASIAARRHDLPPDIVPRLQVMTAENWLCSYREIAGVTHVLRRLGSRLRRPFDLGASVSLLERHKEDLHRDFKIFFPELIARVASGPRPAPPAVNSQIPG